MNGRILAIVVLVAAVLLSIYNAMLVPSIIWMTGANWLTVGVSVSVVLGFGALLLALWVYSDYERHQEDMEDLSNRINEVAEYVDARKLAATQERKSAWICPSCKTLNSDEVTVCQQCKRLKPTH